MINITRTTTRSNTIIIGASFIVRNVYVGRNVLKLAYSKYDYGQDLGVGIDKQPLITHGNNYKVLLKRIRAHQPPEGQKCSVWRLFLVNLQAQCIRSADLVGITVS